MAVTVKRTVCSQYFGPSRVSQPVLRLLSGKRCFELRGGPARIEDCFGRHPFGRRKLVSTA